MELTNLNKLKRDKSELYDLIVATYKHDMSLPFFEYIISEDEEMRIDLISRNIYGSENYTEYILDYNGIDNPLNFIKGDKIKYLSLEDMEKTMVEVKESYYAQKRQFTVLENTDASREEYNSNNSSLTPTTKRTPSKSVTIQGNSINIGGNN